METKETLVYSEWFHRVMRQSQYAPVQVEDEEQSYLTCPGCGGAHKDIEHGHTKVCDCGLSMQRLGNALVIWNDRTDIDRRRHPDRRAGGIVGDTRMKTMLVFLFVVAGCVWSQFMFFGLPQTGRGWLWFISTTLIVAAAWALIVSRKARK